MIEPKDFKEMYTYLSNIASLNGGLQAFKEVKKIIDDGYTGDALKRLLDLYIKMTSEELEKLKDEKN